MKKKYLTLLMCFLMLFTSIFTNPIYAEETSIETVKQIENISFDQEVQLDNVVIKVTAEPGVLPSDSQLSAKKVSAKEAIFQKDTDEETFVSEKVLENIEEAISEVRTNEVAESYTFDISILDSVGNEIQPNGEVNVTFRLVDNKAQNIEATVYHIEEATTQTAEVTELQTEVVQNEQTSEVEIITTTEGFSYYQVEFTYNKLQYVLQSDTIYVDNQEYTAVQLSEIIEYVGLHGEVEAYEVSNVELFNIQELDGTLYIVSYKPFHTDEFLKVTIDGIDYEIVVTDFVPRDLTIINNCKRTISNVKVVGANTKSIGSMSAGAQQYLELDDWGAYSGTAEISGSGISTKYANFSSIPSNYVNLCASNEVTVCTANTSETCSNGYSVTLSINANGGSCSTSSISRTRNNGSRTCNSSGTAWGSCSYGSWGSAPSMPSCSKSNTTETRTITFNGNGGTPGKNSDSASRTLSYSQSSFSNGLSAGNVWNGTENGSTTANYSSSTGSWNKTMTAPSATREGYVFKGWSRSATGSKAYNAGDSLPYDNMTLYAIWEYDVTYDSNKPANATTDITGSTANTTHIYGVSSPLAKNGYALKCYTGIKYNSAANGQGTNYDINSNVTSVVGASNPRTLYVIWEANKYNINYDANGGTNAPEKQVKTYDTELVLTLI